MIDRFERNINNMRISITQQCNLDCFYCHHEGEKNEGAGVENGHLTPPEIEKITQIASQVGIQKLKITGGEPLLRKDIVEIVKRTAKHMKEVSMTTNGVLLKKYAGALNGAGLKRINISFDALDPTTFQRITNKEFFYEVKEGIESAICAGLYPVKLNMVILKGVNDKDIQVAMDYASEIGAVLQLIEFEGSKEESGNSIFKKHYLNLRDWENWLKSRSVEVRQRRMHRRNKYILPSENDGKAEVEIVRAMHNSEFCQNCTRLRVTSSGELKPCLLKNDNLINIIGPIRKGASDKELKDLFEYAILKKEPYWRA
ncbi:MAG: GTP 3',8-cyclase MoaA [Methanomassiliicoccales archaeon]|nr:MAG: GTP 3',8-cyclase MoaA [Methanomassiliicoccales archaeon]